MTTRLEVDVAIVGSGAGGGTVAAALAPLAEAGARILLIDRGGRFGARDHTRRELEMAGKYYVANGAFQTADGTLTLAFCHAVGGCTNVYTGVTFEPPRKVIEEKWAIPGLDLADLQPRLRRYWEENNVHYEPEERINRNNQLFKLGCERLGWPVGQFPLNTKGCIGLNTCNLGCARLAKQGTAVVQIPRAEAAGVEVLPFCRIDTLDEGRTLRGEVLPPQHGLPPAPYPPGPIEIRARVVVLAGSAMGTPPLLMRSFPDWERRWPALGRYFTCHPALTLVAEHADPVEGARGHPKSYYCDHFVDRDGFLLETCFYFPFTTSKNLSGLGPELDELMHAMDRQQQILVLALDRARPENRIAIDARGEPVVHYTIDAELVRTFVAAVRAAGRIFFAAGARRAHLPGAPTFLVDQRDADRLDELVRPERFLLGKVAISAAHLMGGCRMGTDPTTSVTDPWGRVHDLEGVYVADASLFPDSVEVNPYLTIMALADRVAEAVRGEVG